MDYATIFSQDETTTARLEPAVRRLGLHHFAFYRAYLEGVQAVDLGELCDRYLNIGSDPRRVQKTVRWLQDELAAAARRTGDRAAVRLLRLPRLPQEAAAPVMSLEDFRAQRDPNGDFFTEAELIELYQEEVPAPPVSRQARRNRRLHSQRLDALAQLEKTISEAPIPEHDVAGWFDPAIAQRLHAVGLSTLAQLLGVINARGYRWFIHVPRLGEKAAQRIVTWLRANERTIGRLSVRAETPLRKIDIELLHQERGPRSGIAPLELLILPKTLDGRAGVNRAPAERNQTGADNDLDAVMAWLSMHPDEGHTRRSYRAHAERLLNWSVFAAGKPLSSLNAADIVEFMKFLADPAPAERWVSTRRTERWSLAWRPFAGPLNAASRATARNILQSMMQWLVDMRYLDFNPFTGSKPTGEEVDAKHSRRSRSLSSAQWSYLVDYLLDLTQDLHGARARFALLFAYGTGLRRSELASVTTGALEAHQVDDVLGDVWVLTVTGKGSKTGRVPVPKLVMSALRAYLKMRGLPADPEQCPPSTPLIASIRGQGEQPLKPPAIAALFKEILTGAAEQLAKSDLRAAARLRQASTHWLRHTHGTHLIRSGLPLDIAQDNLRHASLDMVSTYNDSDLIRRIRALEEFMD